MKTSQRIPKAIAVIIIIGIGILSRTENKQAIANQFEQFSEKLESNVTKSDSLDSANTENKLFIYTKSIIQTSIRHLISNI
jgi:hypothetical protein